MHSFASFVCFIAAMTGIVSAQWMFPAYTCITCHNNVRHVQKFRACKLLALKDDLKTLNQTLQQMHNEMASQYSYDVTRLRESTHEVDDQLTGTPTFETLLQNIYMFVQKLHMDGQLIESNTRHNPSVYVIVTSFQEQTRKLTCRLRHVLERGLLNKATEANYRACPPFPSYGESAILHYVINFTVENSLHIQRHIDHIMQALS